MIDRSQIRLTTEHFAKDPHAAREEALALLAKKAVAAAHKMLKDAAALSSFEAIRPTHYADSPLPKAIERHTARLQAAEAAVRTIRGRIVQLRGVIGHNSQWADHLDEAKHLANGACAMLEGMRAAWSVEAERLARARETECLKFGTLMSALVPLLNEAVEEDALAA